MRNAAQPPQTNLRRGFLFTVVNRAENNRLISSGLLFAFERKAGSPPQSANALRLPAGKKLQNLVGDVHRPPGARRNTIPVCPTFTGFRLVLVIRWGLRRGGAVCRHTQIQREAAPAGRQSGNVP